MDSSPIGREPFGMILVFIWSVLASIIARLLKELFRGNFQEEAHLIRFAIRVLLLSEVASKKFFEMKIRPFFSNFNDAPPNAYGSLPLSGRIDDTHHNARIALDVASFLMALNGVDENIDSICIYPGLCHMWRSIRH